MAAFDEVLAYAERRTREAIARHPGRRATGRAGEIEGDGVTDDDIPIAVAVDGRRRRAADRLRRAPPTQVAGNVNCPLAVTRSACYFALRVLLPSDVPANAGTYAPLDDRGARGLAR